MPVAVPREKRDALPAKRASDVRPGRIAKRRRHHLLRAVGELRHVVQPAAADDSNLRLHLRHTAYCRYSLPALVDLLQLHEHAVRARRVDERDERAFARPDAATRRSA